MTFKKTILIINWRAINDPRAGGAEIATMELAKRWVQNHQARVIWLCPPPKKGSKKEVIDGVEFYYIGRPLTRNVFALAFLFPYFYSLVFLYYFVVFRNTTDVIIDQAHGLPYLTPLYTTKKVVLYIHEVADTIWAKMYPTPISVVGKLLEFLFFLPYKNTITITVTQATKHDLIKLGLNPTKVVVINNGLTNAVLDQKPQKEPNFTIIYLNRVVKMKRIELALDIFSKLATLDPKAVFWVVGRGEPEYIAELKQLCDQRGLSDNVKFWGFVDDKTKLSLLAKAHVLINTSSKEGWGLVNIEANSQGTPVVAFDVHGNNESVVNGVSGFLVPEGDTKKMVTRLMDLKATPFNWFESCITHAKKYNWDTVSDMFFEQLN